MIFEQLALKDDDEYAIPPDCWTAEYIPNDSKDLIYEG